MVYPPPNHIVGKTGLIMTPTKGNEMDTTTWFVLIIVAIISFWALHTYVLEQKIDSLHKAYKAELEKVAEAEFNSGWSVGYDTAKNPNTYRPIPVPKSTK